MPSTSRHQYENLSEGLIIAQKVSNDFKGDMDKIMDEVPCSTIDDEPRFREFLQNAIDEGKVKSYKVRLSL